MPVASSLPLTEMLSPADAAEAAQMIREAYASATPIYPVGGGTSLDFGLPPRQPGLGLSLEKLAGVIDYPARDMTITVEAGIRMATLNDLLATQRQRLPIDAPRARQATLGGVIATNSSGPRRFGYGTIRDYVIGISAVDGRGTEFKAGGRVVKNVAGYDMCKLLCGSMGTLAFITQVTLKLKPLPAQSAFVVASLTDVTEAERLLAELNRSQTTPVAIELLAGPAWHDEAAVGPDARDELVLAVGLEGTEPEVRWMIDRLRQEWRELGVERSYALSDEAAGQLWDRLTEFPAAEPEALVIKANVLPSCVTSIIGEVTSLAPGSSIQAHAGSGIVVARLPKSPPGEITQILVKHLQPLCTSAAGNIVVLSSPQGVEPTRRAVWGAAQQGAALMQAIKLQFDPRGLFNPGRFVFP